MNEKDPVTVEDLEDLLNFHRSQLPKSEVERLAATINYALDKLLSTIVRQMREEE